MSRSWSAALTGRYGVIPSGSPFAKLLGSSSTGATIFGAALGARFFPSGDAPRGFLLGPSVDLYEVRRDQNAVVLVPGFELGYAWIEGSGFALSLHCGVDYASVISGHLLA